MGNNDHGVLAAEFVEQILDLLCGDRIERTGGLIHQQNVGVHRKRAGNAKALLLAAGKAEGRLFQAVLHLIPQSGAAKRLFNDLVELALVLDPVNARAVGDIVVYAHGERIRLLKHHAGTPAQEIDVGARIIDVLSVDGDLPLNPAAGDHIVHAVERFQAGGFSAAGRADKRRDLVFRHLEGNSVQRLKFVIKQIQILNRNFGCHKLFGSFLQASRECSCQAIEQKYQNQQNRRGSKGNVHGVGSGCLAGRLVQVQSQRAAAAENLLEEALRHLVRKAGGKQQSGGFTDDSAHGEDDRRQYARHGARQHNAENHTQLARAERKRPLFIRGRHRNQGFLRGAHDRGQNAQRHGQAAGQNRNLQPEQDAEYGIPEQSEQNRGNAGKNLGGKTNRLYESALLCVLREVNRRADADRRRDQQRDHDNVHGIDDHGQNALQIRLGFGVRGGKELPADIPEAVDENIAQNADKHHHAQKGRAVDQQL